MGTAINHIKNNLGLDITLSETLQNGKNLFKENSLTDDQLKHLPPRMYLKLIYDVVAGIDGYTGCHFDIGQNDSGRFKCKELRQLAELATKIKNRTDIPDGQKTVLHNISAASNIYKTFLEGGTNLVKKDFKTLGNRHSLARGAQGNIYEMTNSMTPNEVARFKRKTEMTIDAVENPKSHYSQSVYTFAKIELGEGAFGKTRIARNIENDNYVAVKKIHPKIVLSSEYGIVSQKPEESNFYNLDQAHKQLLKRLKNFVITPDDDFLSQSQTSKKIRDLTTDFATWRPESTEEFIAGIDALPKIVKQQFLEMSDADKMKFLKNVLTGSFKNIDNVNNTVYLFSELGITNIDNFINKFNVLRIYFESNKTTEKLTVNSKNLLNKYSKTYHFPNTGTLRPEELKEFQEKAAIENFNSDKFKLKDPIFNQRFLNTLGKKMLTSLANFNNSGLSHHDIKPDNIVFVQNDVKNISVKLIDIDLIKKIRYFERNQVQDVFHLCPPRLS